ncbi:MAG: A/G-specific adenine glycosylase [Bauldia sp.]
MTAAARRLDREPDPADLLAWYDRHARALPWRVPPAERAVGVRPDPYRVWLSEVMLQQTTVAAVKGYYEAFLARWPNVEALAAAPEHDVMKAWAGLGYYSRARNLKAAAEAVAREHGGRFPDSAAALAALPGVGAYTAAAIAAIAFDEPAAVVDGNVERVLARVFALAEPLPAAKPRLRVLQASLTPAERPGDYAQAVMDLGATICTPKRPACSLCPWAEACLARAAGNPEDYPLRAAKAERPTRRGAAFVVTRAGDGAVLLRRRPAKGLLAGMSEVPGTEWRADFDSATALDAAPGLAGGWRKALGPVVQVFTHFRLELAVYAGAAGAAAEPPPDHWWSPPAELGGEALPSLMRKAIAAALPSRPSGSH